MAHSHSHGAVRTGAIMSRRIIATGRKFPPHSTQHWKYALSDPAWQPQPSPEPDEPDYDLIRKLQLESEDLE